VTQVKQKSPEKLNTSDFSNSEKLENAENSKLSESSDSKSETEMSQTKEKLQIIPLPAFMPLKVNLWLKLVKKQITIIWN